MRADGERDGERGGGVVVSAAYGDPAKLIWADAACSQCGAWPKQACSMACPVRVCRVAPSAIGAKEANVREEVKMDHGSGTKIAMGDRVRWGEHEGSVVGIRNVPGGRMVRVSIPGSLETVEVSVEKVAIVGTFLPGQAIGTPWGDGIVKAVDVVHGGRVYSVEMAGRPTLTLIPATLATEPKSEPTIKVGPPARLWVEYVDAVRAVETAAESGTGAQPALDRLADAERAIYAHVVGR